VKLVPEFTDCPLTVTEIGPVVAVAGTVTVSVVAVAAITVAAAPLKLAVLEEAVVLNPWP
jgi:hypothetical protein